MAVAADFLLSITVLGHNEVFTPFSTLAIASIIALPLAWMLVSQQVNLETAHKEQLALLAARESAISEFEDAQVRLRSSEALYRLLADNLTDSISLWSPEGNRLYSSPSIERLMGYTPEEYVDIPVSDIIRPEDRGPLLQILKALTPGGESRTWEYRSRRKDGSEIWVESTYARLSDGSLISTSRDITERWTLRRDLETALVEAQSAVAAKSDFLANMTHELRTPLNAITGFSGVLRGSNRLSPEDRHHVELISGASATLLGVINDVLEFSRLEAGYLDLDPQPFDPGQLARAACALIEDQARDKGLTLTLDIAPDLCGMVGDGPRLSQVLLNLLSNAVKFTGAGHVAVSLRQFVEAETARLRIEVIDTGIGISENQIGNVFERFAQADGGISRQFGGTGLGLAISKRIIERMDGQIGVVSTQGRGSTFWFEVSAPVVSLDAVQAALNEGVSGFTAPLRVLVVEDNAVNRELVCTLLAPFDITIDTAHDGAEGLRATELGIYDLILMDIQMPVMDGLTATRLIRANNNTAPIVALTANVLPEQIAKCLAAGMNDHIGKPFQPARLLETVVRWTQIAA
ncbi:ATP-binding protein [Caulobacter sp. ErkDOM-YI]|uniref:PAS domain-containing hybrid sensor histidine kinase/response regulator n=1 Tax=unclassified Caulobacter TaxID=2648921 RepID=UPI003AF644D8